MLYCRWWKLKFSFPSSSTEAAPYSDTSLTMGKLCWLIPPPLLFWGDINKIALGSRNLMNLCNLHICFKNIFPSPAHASQSHQNFRDSFCMLICNQFAFHGIIEAWMQLYMEATFSCWIVAWETNFFFFMLAQLVTDIFKDIFGFEFSSFFFGLKIFRRIFPFIGNFLFLSAKSITKV